MRRTFSFDGELIESGEAALDPVGGHPLVSVVLTARERHKQLRETLKAFERQTYDRLEFIVVEAEYDGGKTRAVAEDFGAKYFLRENRADRRTSVANNIGIRAATGEVILMQCAEIRHDFPDSVEKLLAPIVEDPATSTFPRVVDLGEDGHFNGFKYHELSHPHCFITFCQMFPREAAFTLHGFDENYVGWGFEDNDFNFRLQLYGVRCLHVDTTVAHQWHASVPVAEMSQSEAYYHARLAALKAGRESVAANEGVDWGAVAH